MIQLSSNPIILALDTSCDPPSPEGFGRASETGAVILAVDTSCDETSAAVTRGTTVLSNVIWSQAFAHAEFGGVMPSLAARMHRERIDFVVRQAISKSQIPMTKINAIAVTAGPGLAIALGVGIEKAKLLATDLKVPLYGINHIEGHLLSPLAEPKTNVQSSMFKEENKINYPALGLVVSGGHTELVYIEKIGKYKILAETQDDALGEALDKAARMLGLGYPGGAILERMARLGNSKAYPLPLPMARQKERHEFSYSGLKTAMFRLIEKITDSRMQIADKETVCDLAASFQNRAFQHLERVIRNTLLTTTPPWPSPNLGEGTKGRSMDLLVGGGVVANVELRKRLRKMGKELGLKVWFPYSKKLIGDNAAMIGVACGLRLNVQRSMFNVQWQNVDRRARWSVEDI